MEFGGRVVVGLHEKSLANFIAKHKVQTYFLNFHQETDYHTKILRNVKYRHHYDLSSLP
jgi:hypothetical protein